MACVVEVGMYAVDSDHVEKFPFKLVWWAHGHLQLRSTPMQLLADVHTREMGCDATPIAIDLQRLSLCCNLVQGKTQAVTRVAKNGFILVTAGGRSCHCMLRKCLLKYR